MEAPNRIAVDAKRALTLEWGDGTVSTIAAATLRDACSCATCRSEAERRPTRLRLVAAAQPITIEDAHLVGGYGINLTFGPDGHRTGIFTYDQLRGLADSSDTST